MEEEEEDGEEEEDKGVVMFRGNGRQIYFKAQLKRNYLIKEGKINRGRIESFQLTVSVKPYCMTTSHVMEQHVLLLKQIFTFR